MFRENIISEKNNDGTFSIKIYDGDTLYEIPSVNPILAPGSEEDWLVKVTYSVTGVTTDKILQQIKNELKLKGE